MKRSLWGALVSSGNIYFFTVSKIFFTVSNQIFTVPNDTFDTVKFLF